MLTAKLVEMTHDANLKPKMANFKPPQENQKLRSDHGCVMMFTFNALSEKNCFDLVSKTKTNTIMIKINIAI